MSRWDSFMRLLNHWQNWQAHSDKTLWKAVKCTFVCMCECAAYIKLCDTSLLFLCDIVDFGKDIKTLSGRELRSKAQHEQLGDWINSINGRQPQRVWSNEKVEVWVCVIENDKACTGMCMSRGVKEVIWFQIII